MNKKLMLLGDVREMPLQAKSVAIASKIADLEALSCGGAEILAEFFHAQLKKFILPTLNPLGQEVIDCCLSGGTVEDYQKFMEEVDV